MKIYFYSGTGNSLYIAKRLKGEKDDLVPIISALKTEENRLSGDILLVFPIYMNGIPKPVRQFIEKMDFTNVDYLAAAATHCGYPGKVGALLNNKLTKKGLMLDEYFTLKMINNTPKGVAPKFLMKLNWEELISDDKFQPLQSEIEKNLPLIQEQINNRTSEFKKNLRTDRSLKGSIFTKILWSLSSGQNPKLNFLLDASCTGCGTCEKVCPSGRIKLMEGVPNWTEDTECYYCYACFNFCPEQAIGVKYYTKKQGRYHHPEINLDDIIGQK